MFSIHPSARPRAGLFARLRRGMHAALVAGALLPAAAAAQAPALPDSPAGQRFSAFMATLAQSDTASIRAFVDGQMNAQFRSIPFPAHVEAITQMRADLRGARLVALEALAPTELAATLEAGGRRFVVQFAVDEAAPNRISGLGMDPEDATRPAPETLAAAQVSELVDSIAVQMERNYVSADTGRRIADHLRARRDAGAYAAVTRPADLVAAMAPDLRAVNGDAHLYLQLNTGGRAAGRPDPAAERRGNYGFARVERLEGNVGYIRLTSFSGAPEARDVAVNALRFIQNTDAVILDVRAVPGGSAEMSNFLISHFTAPDLPSLNVHLREGDRTETRATLAEVPGPRRTDVPLYVLMDRGAASAAEDLPFVLRNLGRATLVGDRTMGAGRNNRTFPVGYGMGVSVSVSRVTDPASGREWEGVGVQPDIATSPEGALAAAHQDALRTLAAAAPDEGRRDVLAATAEYVAAQSRPAPVAAERLAAVAGSYGGRMVTAEAGRLYYQRSADAPRVEMLPLADGRLALTAVLRAEFVPVEGGRLQLRLTAPGEPPRTFDRQP